MAGVEFGLLGPLIVRHDDVPLPVSPGKQRVLLAALLLNANRVMSMAELVDTLWEGSSGPPASARVTLQNYVKRLRIALRATGTNRIGTSSGGYLINVDTAEFDVARFVDLAATSGHAAAAHAWETAERDARAALALWRDEPLTGVPSDRLALREVPRLKELWLDTAETRIDAVLHLGGHHGLVTELRDLVDRYPLREHLRVQLMLALAGTGQQAEALAVYQHTRQLLIDEIGVEPGPELRRLHEQILAGAIPIASPEQRPSPGVTRLDRDPAPSAAVPPFQLPADTRHFTGRAEHLSQLLSPRPQPEATAVVTAVGGMAGIGKTALAVHAAHQLADRYPDGVLFVDLRGFTPDAAPTPPEQALDQLLRGLGVPGTEIPPDLGGRTGLYRSILSRRRVLIVLDNAMHEAQVQPLLPAVPGCRVIVTSRRHLAGLDDATHLNLPVLDPAEAAGLFERLAGGQVSPADQKIIERIVALCGQLPLAIRVAAARLRLAPGGRLATLCAELDDAIGAGHGLEWLSDGHRAVEAALAVSYRHLTQDQRHVFRLAGLHPGNDIEPYAMAALANTTADRCRSLLEELYAANLINQPAHRRYALHDLVVAYATRLAADIPEPDRRAALDRLFEQYAATSSRAVGLTHPWEAHLLPEPPATDVPTVTLADREHAQAWLNDETDNLLAAAHDAAAAGRGDHTLHQSEILRRHLRTRGQYGQAAVLHEQALDIARQTGDRHGEQDALDGLGNIHRLLGRYGPAADCLEQALGIARGIGDRHGEQEVLNGLGTVHYAQGDYGPAAECYERALAGARRTGNGNGEQESLRGLGYLHYMQGRYGRAAACLDQALAIARRIGNRHGEQIALRGLGTVHYLRGHYRQAADCYERALANDRRTGNRRGEQDALNGLGNVHYAQGRCGPAADCYEQALCIARRTGNRSGELYTLRGLANVHYAQGRYQPAADCYGQVLAGADQTGNRNGQFEAHHGLGRVHHATDDHDAALRHHQTALDLAIDLDQPADQARAHDGLAHAHQALHQPEQARLHWRTAVDLLTGIGTDHTEEPDVTTAAIRTHLRDLDNQPASPNSRTAQ